MVTALAAFDRLQARIGPLCASVLSAALLTLAASAAWAQTAVARVDREELGLRDILTLEISVETQGRVAFGELATTDFEIVGPPVTSMSQRFDSTGAYSSVSQILRLRPMRTGALVIPPVSVATARGTVQTQAITVTVTEDAPPARAQTPVAPTVRAPIAQAAPTPARDDGTAIPPTPSPRSDAWAWGPVPRAGRGDAFLVARVSQPAPVVGEQLIVEYALCSPVGAFGISLLGATQPEFSGAWFRDVADIRVDRRGLGSQRINDNFYDVNLVGAYVVVPTEPGEFIIPPFELELAADALMRGRRAERLVSTPLRLEAVLPPADAMPAGASDRNVGRVALTARADRDTVRVGEPLRIRVEARGSALLSRLRLPSLPRIPGLRVSDESDEVEQDVGASGWIEGYAARVFTVMADTPGELTVPPISMAYWDPFQRAWRDTVSEALTLRVEAAPDSGPGASAGADVIDRWTDRLPTPRSLEADPPAPLPAALGSPAAAGVAALPPLGLGMWLAAGTLARRRRAQAPARRARTIGTDTLRALDDLPDDPREAARALAVLLRDYAAERLGRPVRGLTHAALRDACAAALGESGRALADVVADAEAARYAGAVDLGALRDAAKSAVRDAEAAR